jgi:hypothetical protein
MSTNKKEKVSYTKNELNKAVKAERERSVSAVMDLFYALRDINGTPNMKDLVKLAGRIRKG